MTSWNDFNDAEDQNQFEVIPAGTLLKVRMTLKPGGHNEPSMGWNDGYATQNADTGAVYLNAEFVGLEGPFARRKLWTLIGLHSPKGPAWAGMGRSMVRGILQSARGIRTDDRSPRAQQARQIQSFSELDGIEFVARVAVERDQYGDEKNVIKQAVTPEHKDYARLMGIAPQTQQAQSQPQAPGQQQGEQPPFPSEPPSWA